MDISVVIPAYNEEQYIQQTISSINSWIPQIYNYEIIVVDHGSSDATAELANASGANVVSGNGMKTIASLRNLGVECAHGNILFFIDADITFTKEWSLNITEIIKSLENDPYQICGSFPRIPDDSSLLMKYWFGPKSMSKKTKYIGSGHLLTTKNLFNRIGGYPENMETAEDFTFCLNATSQGAKLTVFPELVVVHHGSPKTLMEFSKREIWHGRGDWTNIYSILSSRIAVLTLFFILAHVIFIFSWFNSNEINFFVGISFFTICFICLFSSYVKFSTHGVKYIIVNSITFYIYFFSRALSALSVVFTKKFKKRSRSK